MSCDEYGFGMSINKAYYDFDHDSITDNIRNPSIFDIQEDGSAYPMFIIHFK